MLGHVDGRRMDGGRRGPPRTPRSHPGAPLPTIAVAELPKEARTTLERIRDRKTFPYDRDGVVFGNREGILPALAARVLSRIYRQDAGRAQPWRAKDRMRRREGNRHRLLLL